MRTVFVVFFGIVTPLLALAVEWATGMSAEVFFDPIPTLWHAFLVASVPLANLLVLLGAKGSWRCHGLLAWLNAVAIGVALVYTVAYLPITPFALPAIIAYGLGLLPLAPLTSFVSAILLRAEMKSATEPEGTAWRERRMIRHSLPLGLVLGVTALVLPEIPELITYAEISSATSSQGEIRAKGLALLRRFGSEDRLLRMCYGVRGRSIQLTSTVMEPLSPKEAQDLFFRVTGRPFNSVPPPRNVRRHFSRGGELEAFDFDPDLGGQVVAGRRKGLSLVNSRLDASVAAEEATVYLEWDLTFRNDHWQQREARAQVLLPPGGVVSRLTLWVNGEPREAAFAGVGQVREAYRKVAVEQRRDPVLVTWAGVDRVLMQCFPVPPSGGQMRVRLGITAPLALDQPERGVFRLPSLIERNFGMTEAGQHAVWVESAASLEAPEGLLQQEQPEGKHVLQGTLSDAQLSAPSATVEVSRSKASAETWSPDPHAPKQIVVQKVGEVQSPPAERIVLVVDGSLSMAEHLDAIAQAVEEFPRDAELHLMVASDEVIDLSPDLAESKVRLAKRLVAVAGKGGCDNVPALVQACRKASDRKRGVVIWIHGPQPVVLDPIEPLLQRSERLHDKTRIYDLQVVSGPNRVVEPPEMLGAIVPVRFTGDIKDDLARLMSRVQGREKRSELTRSQTPGESRPSVKGSAHLARLWAHDRVLEMLQGGPGGRQEAIALASKYQLVTPVSGAVVLETQAQYDAANLRPADPDTVPTVPEPETWALVAVVLAILAVEIGRRAWRGRPA